MKKLKNRSVFVFGTTLFVVCCTAKAEQKFDLTVRYVNSFEVVNKSKDGQEITKELQNKQIELTKKIKESEMEFTAAAKEFQEKSPVMSDSGRETEQKKLVKKEREHKALLQESDEDLKITAQSKQQQLFMQHNEAVAKYAKENNIDLILGPGGVVFASEKADCTKQIVAEMDKNHDIRIAKARGTKSKDIA